MRLVSSLAAVFVLMACSHTRDEMHAVAPNEREVLAVESVPPPPESPAPVSRPRLSQTVTLGQGTVAQYTPSAPPVPPQAAPNPSVVVNNNVVVQGTPGYVGYGGYRSFGGYGHATTTTVNRQWGSSGWEGARRTAAPGQTPGIGGNWPAPPSYGPATMK